MSKIPPAVWSLAFILIGLGAMAIAIPVHDGSVKAKFLETGVGLVSAGGWIFQHTVKPSDSEKSDKSQSQPPV